MLLPRLASTLLLASAALPALAMAALVPRSEPRAASASLPALPALTDSFYDDPGNLTLYAPGQVVRTRSVETKVVDASLAHASQVVYRTTNTQNQPSWSVATIFTPANQSASGAERIFSLQLYEDSANLNCAPSQWVVKGAAAALPYGAEVGVYLAWAVRNGWHTVVPDHEGPNSGFLSGHEEGQAVLDAIRAARNASGLPADTPVGLYGYSGGAHATAWAVNLAESYAPDVHVAGASYGGTPVDPASLAQNVDNTVNSGLLPSALAGALNTQPESFKNELLAFCSPAFAAAIQAATENCNLAVMAAFANQPIAALCNQTLGEKLWQPAATPFWSLLANESLLSNVSSLPIAHPSFPLLIQHGGSDTTVPSAAVEAYVEQQCAAKSQVQWVSWPGQDHLPTIKVSMPATMQFFQRVFSGALPTAACGQPPCDLLSLASSDLRATLGDSTARAILAIDGPNSSPAPSSSSSSSPGSASSRCAAPSGTSSAGAAGTSAPAQSTHPNGAASHTPRGGLQPWLLALSLGALLWALQ